MLFFTFSTFRTIYALLVYFFQVKDYSYLSKINIFCGCCYIILIICAVYVYKKNKIKEYSLEDHLIVK